MNANLKYADILASGLRDKDVSDADTRDSVYEKVRISLKQALQKNNLIGTPTEAKLMRSLEQTIAAFEHEIVARLNHQPIAPEPAVSEIAEPVQVELDEPKAGRVNSRLHLPDFRWFFGRFGLTLGVGLAVFLMAVFAGLGYFYFTNGNINKVAGTETGLTKKYKELTGEALLSTLRTKGRGEATLTDRGDVRLVSVRQAGKMDRQARPIVLRYPRNASGAFRNKTVLATIRMRQETPGNNATQSKTKVRVTLSPAEIVDPVSKVFEIDAEPSDYFVVALTTDGRKDSAAVTLRFNTDLEPSIKASGKGKAILVESVKMELF